MSVTAHVKDTVNLFENITSTLDIFSGLLLLLNFWAAFEGEKMVLSNP